MKSSSILLAFLMNAVVSLAAEKNGITFNRDVRPILSNNCFACHGFDEKERKADLRLDTPEGALVDLGGYRAIVPGDLANSEAWQRITSEDDDEVMPPPDSHGKLPQDQKQTVKKWIEQGAVYEKHWSFIAPQQPEVPRLKGEGNEVDAFLQQRLAVEEMEPSEKASKEIDRLQQMPPMSAESGVIRTYVDWMLAVPWQERTENNIQVYSIM